MQIACINNLNLFPSMESKLKLLYPLADSVDLAEILRPTKWLYYFGPFATWTEAFNLPSRLRPRAPRILATEASETSDQPTCCTKDLMNFINLLKPHALQPRATQHNTTQPASSVQSTDRQAGHTNNGSKNLINCSPRGSRIRKIAVAAGAETAGSGAVSWHSDGARRGAFFASQQSAGRSKSAWPNDFPVMPS